MHTWHTWRATLMFFFPQTGFLNSLFCDIGSSRLRLPSRLLWARGEQLLSAPLCPRHPLSPRGWVAPSGGLHPPGGATEAPHPGSAARPAAAIAGGATGTVGTTHAGSGRKPGAWRSSGEAEQLNQRRLRRAEGGGCGGAQPGRGAWGSRAGEPGEDAGPLGDAERAGAWGSGHGGEGIREAGTGD